MTQQTLITKYDNILVQEDIEYLLNLQEVQQAKKDIDSLENGKIYFSIDLPPQIQEKLLQTFNINVSKVPMRWIKGDMPPHEDKGASSFENTYLIYLTDSQGSFIVNGNSYPITQNTGYVFSEGLTHETINTGSEPRLLLGPMSEQGFAVGSSIGADGGSTIYFGQVDPSGNPDPSANISYKVNDGEWISIGNNYPMYISNYNTSLGFLNIEFFTDLIIDNNFASGINKYFICGSEYIQFGKSSLKSDGTRPQIIISVNNYDGFIQNGDEINPGQSNIYVYNLNFICGSNKPQIGAGWIGRKGFGNSAANNRIINCSSNGDLPGGAIGSGGIVGSFAGINVGADLGIVGCSSSGQIGQLDGGIVGAFAGQLGGSVTCLQCFSIGQITAFSGGIFGDYAGYQGGVAIAVKCYTTGNIGNSAGGIYGRYAAYYGQAFAQQCYTRGIIDIDGGGIFGIGAGIGNLISQVARASNCYSSGLVTTNGNGIFGTGLGANTASGFCYIANNNWNSSLANSNLQGIPSPIIGTTWISTGLNTPYILNNFGYTPYDISNISNNSLIQSYSQTINAGSTTIAGIRNGLSYQILDIFNNGSFGSFPSITINSNTGRISTTSGTTSGSYTLYIRNNDDYSGYNITQFNLTVNPSSSPTNEFSQLLLLLILLKNRRKMILGHTY